MKNLVKFSLFEEVNPRDISLMHSELDNYFTISFEFEIETLDKSNIKVKFKNIDEEFVDDIIETVYKDMSIRKKYEKELVSNLVFTLYDYVVSDHMDIETFEYIFDLIKYDTDRDREIVEHLRNSIKSFVYEENYTYLKRMVKTHMPNFIRKWNRRIDFVGDSTLERGIEIKPKTYISSLSESIEMINDFYNDLEKQDYWQFSERTGLHINIGSSQKVKWNPIKGLLILNDFSDSDKTPYAFKGMLWRMNNKFCSSLIPHLRNLTDIEKNMIKNIDINNLEESEEILNSFLTKKVNQIGFKSFGFNITKLSDNYCEFRYAGGVIPKEVLIEKVKYFCFVVYCMTNSEYKRREYIKKLYKFISNI
jgi:hypothetical protein